MGCNNGNIMYQALSEMHQPDRKILDRRGGLKELAHAWSQRGDPMRKYKVEHPPRVMYFERLWNYVKGRKTRNDKKLGNSRVAYGRREQIATDATKLNKIQQNNSWRTHQPVASIKRGRCSFGGCPGWKRTNVKRKEPFQTRQRCEDCSADAGGDVFYCNDIRDGKAHNCHLTHHTKYFSNGSKKARLA